jgi:hypothetical protein
MAKVSNLIKALEIIRKKSDDEYFSAEHDELYLPGNPEDFGQEELLELDKLGVIVDKEVGSFKLFT